jgi:hypothetical protein
MLKSYFKFMTTLQSINTQLDSAHETSLQTERRPPTRTKEQGNLRKFRAAKIKKDAQHPPQQKHLAKLPANMHPTTLSAH